MRRANEGKRKHRPMKEYKSSHDDETCTSVALDYCYMLHHLFTSSPHLTSPSQKMLLSMYLLSCLFIFSPFVPISCVTIHHRNDQSNNAFHFHPHTAYETPQSLTRRMAYGLLVANPAPMQIAALPAGFMHQNYL